MEISDLCCNSSIWKGGTDKFIRGREDYYGKDFTEGAIVEAINGNSKGRTGMVVYLSGRGDCCIGDLREKPSRINGHNWREEGENLKLVSESPMNKEQYKRLKNNSLFDTDIGKELFDLRLEHLYIFGDPLEKENVEGTLLYSLGCQRSFLSWFSEKESSSVYSPKKRTIKPFNPHTNETAKRFHNSKYIDAFIKESISDSLLNKESELESLPF